MAPRVWLITGCSTGFGRELAFQVLKRGDKVIATARNPTKLADLKSAGADTRALDVTKGLPELKQIIESAHAVHGKIDVLVNNAGFVFAGSIEESSPEDTFSQFNTNLFGTLNVTRAVLPYMRVQKSGIIADISSVAAWRGLPGAANYNASKAALSIFSESLRDEVEPFGIKVIAIEPGYFRSNLLHQDSNRQHSENHIAEYDGTPARATLDLLNAVNNKQPGDVAKGCAVIIDVLTQSGSASGRDIPPRLALGADSNAFIGQKCKSTLALLDEWKDVTTATNHDVA